MGGTNGRLFEENERYIDRCRITNSRSRPHAYHRHFLDPQCLWIGKILGAVSRSLSTCGLTIKDKKYKREGEGLLFDVICSSIDGTLTSFRSRKDKLHMYHEVLHGVDRHDQLR